MSLSTEKSVISGINVEVTQGGSGRPLLYLHGGQGLRGIEPCLAALAVNHHVIAPSHPGFGASDWPHEYKSIADLAYFYLDLAEHYDLRGATLVGACIGGWLAAEVLIRSTHRFSHLVLVDALGLKFGDRLTREIADTHGMYKVDADKLIYADPSIGARDLTQLSDVELSAIAQNREAFVFYGWKPYMHNPGLRHWLHRIDLPTLVLWGAQDGVVTTDYGRNYANAIPGAKFDVIDNAGHYPDIEQPQELANKILAFVG